MAEPFIRLTRVGNGFQMEDSRPGGQVMCVERIVIGVVLASATQIFPTTFKLEDYCACVCGWDSDNTVFDATRFKMEKNTTSGCWELVVTAGLSATGANACADVMFISRSLCKDNF